MNRRAPPIQTVPNVGDWLTLDCGYGPHTMDYPCRILSLSWVSGLFSGTNLMASVQMGTYGEVFDTDLIHLRD